MGKLEIEKEQIMITIRLKGGMGNQMFQYAMGRKIADVLNTEMQLDLSSLLDRSKGDFVYRNYDLPIFHVKDKLVMSPRFLQTIYKPKIPRITKMVRQYIDKGKTFIKEKDFHFQPEIIANPIDNAVYEGWFQSAKYFKGIENTIREDFKFQDAILEESKPLLEKIKTTNAVCLNVRRTDFLKVDTLNTTNKDYFFNAAKYIAGRVENPTFFVFSDDVEWCRENIVMDFPVVVVGHEHKGRKFGNYMQLMIACQHFIIPNSSYAWWAVWLNEHTSKIVVAPKNWFNDVTINTADLVPKKWIRL